MASLQPGFSSARVDFGIIVSDVERSATFYKTLGFKEVEGFDVPAEMGEKSGLTDKGKPFSVRIFQLGDGEAATNVKIMQFAGTKSQQTDTSFIHSTLGIRYLTLYVDDINSAVARARQAGTSVLAQGPYQISPDGVYLALIRDPDGNPIELIGPRK
jgi:catechol 2,3-dioxygenase-like lactoylglutathione lyase family enzyme